MEAVWKVPKLRCGQCQEVLIGEITMSHREWYTWVSCPRGHHHIGGGGVTVKEAHKHLLAKIQEMKKEGKITDATHD